MALIDTLYSMGITPQGIFGHSTGEGAALYADGRGDKESILVPAYYKGGKLMQTIFQPVRRNHLSINLEVVPLTEF